MSVLEGELVVQDNLTLTNELTIAVRSDGSATFAVEGNLTLAEGSTPAALSMESKASTEPSR